MKAQGILRYSKWTSFAGVEGLFWGDVCPVLVLFHRTSWAVPICQGHFLRCHFLLFFSSFLSPHHPGWVYPELQNCILNWQLGCSSCRYPKLNSIEFIIFLSKLASLPVFFFILFYARIESQSWVFPLPPSFIWSLNAFCSPSKSLSVLSLPLYSHCHCSSSGFMIVS